MTWVHCKKQALRDSIDENLSHGRHRLTATFGNYTLIETEKIIASFSYHKAEEGLIF